MTGRLLAVATLAVVPALLIRSLASAPSERPRELGHVRWLRSHDAALEAARPSERPLLILFDEVPGCATCVSFGESVLQHPLLVEAIESEFVPLAIYNNAGGDDRRALKRFGEPAWNNPVVRIVDPSGRDLAPRHAGDYTVPGLARKMVTALETADRVVPPYVRLLAAGARAETTTFGMDCFWRGEACLGGIEGVVSTRTGWRGGGEVVELRFDPTLIDLAGLRREARRRGCATTFVTGDRGEREVARREGWRVAIVDRGLRPTPGDDAHHLMRSSLRHLPLNEAQRTRVNAALASGAPLDAWLSPRQRRLAAAIARHPEARWPAPDPGRLASSLARAEQIATRLD